LPKSVKSGNLGLKEFPRVLARVDIVPRAKEGRVSGFDSGSKSPFAAQMKAQDRRCAKMQGTAFGRRS
jgi:hypothetical protein